MTLFLRTSLLIALTLMAAAASAEPLRLQVDLSENELRALVGDEEIARYPVSVGKDSNPTPAGTYKISKLIWNPSWVPPNEKWAKGKSAKPPGHPENPMKRVKIFFKQPDYYIHGTGDEDQLGSPASHGCIRMSPEDVTSLARMVMEYGGKPQPEPWYRRVLRRRSTKVVILSNPVGIEIRG